MSFKLLTEHYLEFLNLTGGCTGSSESTLVKMPHCWKSHVAAQLFGHSMAPVDILHSRRLKHIQYLFLFQGAQRFVFDYFIIKKK